MSSPRKRRQAEPLAEERTPTKVKKAVEAEKSITDSLKRASAAYANLSWAEMCMEDDGKRASVSVEKVDVVVEAEETGVRTRSRKNGTPKRNADGGKPKFEKALDLASAMSSVRSERVQKLAEEKRRVEEGGRSRRSQRTANDDRKRQHSVSSVASSVAPRTPGSAGRPRRKNPRVEEKDNGGFSSSAGSSPRTPRALGKRLNFDDGISPKPKDTYVDPKLGWCEDEATLKRRTKEVNNAKEKDVYQRYVAEVPVSARQRGVHPRTPNKYLNHSRRNWDAQVRQWKRDLYAWAGESCPSSVNTSRAPSVCGDLEEGHEAENRPTTKAYQSVLDNPDNMASLLGHFDMNTRTMVQAEESTLKAAERPTPNQPLDFSQMNN